MRLGLSVAEEDASVDTICKGIAAGFFANAAVLQAEGASDPTDTAGPAYRLVRCSTVVAGRPPPLLRVHKSSVLFRCKPEWVVFTNATQTFPG